jgi:hypothetical protein
MSARYNLVTSRAFVFLIASARRDGNSETLARRASSFLPQETSQQWLRLSELTLPPFEDFRHGGVPFPVPSGVERILFDATLAATDLVFVAPVYWYSLPASAKLYLDYWTAWLRSKEVDFEARMTGKTLWSINALSDEDHRLAEPLLSTLKLSAEYMKMRWGGALLGVGNRPGDVLNDDAALARAETFLIGS